MTNKPFIDITKQVNHGLDSLSFVYYKILKCSNNLIKIIIIIKSLILNILSTIFHIYNLYSYTLTSKIFLVVYWKRKKIISLFLKYLIINVIIKNW